MKTALVYALTVALLVVGGINIDMTGAEAEDASFKLFAKNITGFNGNGTYEVEVAKAAWQTWDENGFYNLGYFESDMPFTLTDVKINVNGTYDFLVWETKEADQKDDVYKVDLPNEWDGVTTAGTLYTTEDGTAKIEFIEQQKQMELKVNDTKESITSCKITFTYTNTAPTPDPNATPTPEPTIDPAGAQLAEEGICLNWIGSWVKEAKDNETTTQSIATGSKAKVNINGGGNFWIAISDLALSDMTSPTLELKYVANGDTPQICNGEWSEIATDSELSGNFTCALNGDLTDLILTSKNNKLNYTAISIYDNTQAYAKVKIANRITDAEKLAESNYTSASWTTFQTALTAAKAITDTSTLDEINTAIKNLETAVAGLEATGDATPTPAPGGDATPTPAPGGDATPTPAPGGNATPTPVPGGNATPTPAPGGDNTSTTVGLAKNAKTTVGNFTYKVTKTSVKKAGKTTNGTVTVAAMSKKGKKAKKLSVPATVKASGATYNVTAVGAKAMKGAKATSVTLGKNVKSIGKSAFASCKKLSKLSIKAKLSSVAKGAFKGCKKKIKVSGTSKKQNVKKLKKSGYKKFK